jgi:hypothetical protein
LRWGSQRNITRKEQAIMSDLPKFDELIKLAQHHPEALEKLREKHIEKLIDGAEVNYQPRLRGLQFQIDAHRSIHANSPLGSCMKISQMMHESFAELRGWLNQMSEFNDPLRDIADKSEQDHNKVADVLAFPSS